MNRKKIWMRWVMIFTMMVMITGCAVNKNRKVPTPSSAIQENTIYEITNRLTEPVGSYFWYYTKSDKVYAISFKKTSGTEDSSKLYKTTLYKMDNQGNITEETLLPEDFMEKVYSDVYFDSSDNMYYISTIDSRDSEQTELIKLDHAGNIVNSVNLSDVLDLSANQIIDDLVVNSEGIVALFLKNTVFLLNQDLVLFDKIAVNNGNVCDLTISNDDAFLCVLSNDTGESTEYEVAALDLAAKKIGTRYKMNTNAYTDILCGIGDYDYYYTDEYGIYGCHMKKESSEKILDYMLSDITFTDLKPLSNGNFIGETTLDDEQDMLVLYSPKRNDSADNLTIITYGTVTPDTDIKDAIYTFNQSHSDVAIVMKDYSSESDPIAKMNLDIISGQAPDLMEISSLPAEQYIEKGLFEDLSAFYDSDPDIDTKDLIPSVLEAMEQDGRLYYIATGFDVLTLAVKKSETANQSGWTYSELNQFLEKQSKNAQFFYLNWKQDILHAILWCQMTDFMNDKTGDCNFDSEDFKNLLRICNERGSDSEEYEWDDDERTLLQKGSILFKEASTDMDTFKETLAVFDEDVNFIGYPCQDRQGNYICFSTQIGISSKSEHKEEAWEFLRMLMTKEYQGQQMSFEHLPTRNDCFQLRIEAEQATENYTNEMGREIFIHREEVDMDGFTYQIAPLTQQQTDQYVAMINQAVKVVKHNPEIMHIIEEEAERYFAGDRDLDSTAEIIQKRATTYMNEKY